MCLLYTPGSMNSLFGALFWEFWKGILGVARDYLGRISEVLGKCFGRFLAWGSERCVKGFLRRAETNRADTGTTWPQICAFRGVQCDHKCPENGALGLQIEAKMSPKWSLGANKNACEKCLPPKSRFTQDLGVAFWCHFWTNIDARNEAEKRWV